MQVLKVADRNICTDAEGYQQLVNFYYAAKEYNDQTISLDFYQITWFEANMAAVLASILHKLSKENNLQFSTDGVFIKQKFDVLIRNGFITFEGAVTGDERKTTIPMKSFWKTDKHGFINYIEQNLMNHRGMPNLSDLRKEQIKDDLIELMSNINYHSNTAYPFFVCGQYYPSTDYLIFTMVDLGDGFLPKIQMATNGKITDAKTAISWALSGQTTKPHQEKVPGGLGIRNIYNYCRDNQGKFHIATGDAFWQSDLECFTSAGCKILPNAFVGSSINLFFKHS
ncbi:MAG TPA: hypothetical protein VNS58_09090 [Puia sp.]|nr:hypothetical protein [Puia sp.]